MIFFVHFCGVLQYQEFIIDELRQSIENLMATQAAVIKEHEEQVKLKEEQHNLLHPHVKADDVKHQFRNNHHQLAESHSHEDESELIKLGRTWNADAEFENAGKVGVFFTVVSLYC